MKKFFENKPRAWFVVGLIFIAVITIATVAYLLLQKNDPNTLAIVGSEKITKLDLTRKAYGVDLSGDLNDPDLIDKKGLTDDLKKQLFESLIKESVIRQTAPSYNVTVSDEEIEEKSKQNEKYDELSNEQINVLNIASKNLLLAEKLEAKVLNVKKGHYLNIRFDRYLAETPQWITEAEQQEWDKLKEERLIASREYADNLKERLYSDLTSEKITFEEAMLLVDNDKTLDYANWEYTIGDQTFTFDTSNSPTGSDITGDVNFKNAIETTEVGQIAAPFVRKLDYGTEENSELKDSMWTILMVTEKVTGETDDFEDWLNIKMNDLGVKYKDRKYAFGKFISDVQALSLDGCSVGRLNQGTDHPGDMIAQLRIYFADGSPYLNNTGSQIWTRPQVGAYAYSGCPIPVAGGYAVAKMSDYMADEPDDTLYWYSENTNSAGCAYRFAYLAADTINQCCGDSHNPHQYRVRNLLTSYPYNHGYWTHYYWGYGDTSWSDPTYFGWGHQMWSDNFTRDIRNGETLYLQAWFHVPANTAPTPIYNTPEAATTYSISAGSTTYPLKFTLSGTDPNGDTVGLGVAYCAADPTTHNCTGAWNYVDEAHSTSFTNGALFTPVQGATSTLRSMPTSSINLPAGHYRYVIIAIDEHGVCDSTLGDAAAGGPNCWTHDSARYFTVSNPIPPTLSCSVSPSEGPVPLVVTVSTVATNLASSVFDYQFQKVRPEIGAVETLTGRGASVYYTLPGSGYYNAWVRNAGYLSNQWVQCTPAEVNVTDPTDSDGGEVAP